MKKLALLGSNKGHVLEAMKKHFEGKDIEITCVSDDEHSEFFQKAKEFEFKTKLLPFEMNFEYFSSHEFDLIAVCDYKHELQKDVIKMGKFINIHYSLLPAFRGNDELYRSFNSGIKVSGITIHTLAEDIESEKIITQYPILIGNLMHFDEFVNGIYAIEDSLYPIVVEKLLKDEVFDFTDLLNSHSCGGSCGSCGGCH